MMEEFLLNLPRSIRRWSLNNLAFCLLSLVAHFTFSFNAANEWAYGWMDQKAPPPPPPTP